MKAVVLDQHAAWAYQTAGLSPSLSSVYPPYGRAMSPVRLGSGYLNYNLDPALAKAWLNPPATAGLRICPGLRNTLRV